MDANDLHQQQQHSNRMGKVITTASTTFNNENLKETSFLPYHNLSLKNEYNKNVAKGEGDMIQAQQHQDSVKNSIIEENLHKIFDSDCTEEQYENTDFIERQCSLRSNEYHKVVDGNQIQQSGVQNITCDFQQNLLSTTNDHDCVSNNNDNTCAKSGGTSTTKSLINTYLSQQQQYYDEVNLAVERNVSYSPEAECENLGNQSTKYRSLIMITSQDQDSLESNPSTSHVNIITSDTTRMISNKNNKNNRDLGNSIVVNCTNSESGLNENGNNIDLNSSVCFDVRSLEKVNKLNYSSTSLSQQYRQHLKNREDKKSLGESDDKNVISGNVDYNNDDGQNYQYDQTNKCESDLSVENSANNSVTSICSSNNDVTVVTGGNTLSAVVCLEDGLADDDSWVEEISHDEEEFVATTTESDVDSGEDTSLSALIDREEELRGYNRTAIDFTLHTIVEESCEESEIEQNDKKKHRMSASELENTFSMD